MTFVSGCASVKQKCESVCDYRAACPSRILNEKSIGCGKLLIQLDVFGSRFAFVSACTCTAPERCII
jgi:hypothetical protein